MPRKSTATNTKRGYVTMSRRPTKYNVYCVRKDDAVVFESVILSEAQAVRRDCAGELVTVPRDTSPGLS